MYSCNLGQQFKAWNKLATADRFYAKFPNDTEKPGEHMSTSKWLDALGGIFLCFLENLFRWSTFLVL